MLEIILMIALCKRLGKTLRDKGRKPLWFQVMLVVFWFGGELMGGILAGVIHAVRFGDAPMDIGVSTYLLAIGVGACGAGLVFFIAHMLTDLNMTVSDEIIATHAPQGGEFFAADPANPYSSPRTPN